MKLFNSIFIVLLILTAYSCVENEAEITSYEPYITISFYNASNKVITTSINKLTAIGFMDSLSYPDPVTTFKLPLDINTNETTWIIERGSNKDTLSIGYEPKIEDELNVLRFLLYNPTVLYHTFDSVSITCDTICISNDALLKLY